MSDQSCHSLTPPLWLEGSHQALHLESTLVDLPLCCFQLDWSYLGLDLAQAFEHHPFLPGGILLEQGRYAGMISRQRLLEYLIRPHGLELFLKQPLRVLLSYARCDVLILPSETSILVAAQQALRRSPELLNEPILVQADAPVPYLLDSQVLNIAHWQIRGIETQVRYERTQAQMIQSDKMASLGRLVDGIAHEILDPVSFIWGNLSHVTAYSEGLLELLTLYEQHLSDVPEALRQRRDELEIDYIAQDLPQAIESIRTGADRLSKLATSLQTFCHLDEVYPKPADIHGLLDSILLLLKSRLGSDIRVIRRYGHLPPVPCYASQLNQVFMNILSNAVDALINQAVSRQLDLDFNTGKPRSGTSAAAAKPTITITTQMRSLLSSTGDASRWVSICIADNGPGLSPEVAQQLQESFSVKQRALKETSLAVSYQIITAKHGGKFVVRSRRDSSRESRGHLTEEWSQPSVREISSYVSSRPDQQNFSEEIGTEFEILLPLA